MPEAKLYCGTSGFAYPSWKPNFYPEKLPTSKFLSYYATRLNAVEVNYTYRRLASAATFEKWIATTPPDFMFLPKAHMKITHHLKLLEAEDNMNCQMADVCVTFRDGRTHQLENVFVRGSKIRFMVLPDMLKNAPMFKNIGRAQKGAVGMGLGGTEGPIRGGGRGRGTAFRRGSGVRGGPRGMSRPGGPFRG